MDDLPLIKRSACLWATVSSHRLESFWSNVVLTIKWGHNLALVYFRSSWVLESYLVCLKVRHCKREFRARILSRRYLLNMFLLEHNKPNFAYQKWCDCLCFLLSKHIFLSMQLFFLHVCLCVIFGCSILTGLLSFMVSSL